MIPGKAKAPLILELLALFAFLGAALPKGSGLAMPPVQRLVLPNQLVVVVLEEHSLPFVTLRLLMDAGSWRDPLGKEGLANLTAKGLLLGTSSHSETEINDTLDFMGANLGSSCGMDYVTVGLRILKKDLERGFSLFLEALTQPTFPEGGFQRERKKVLGVIRSEEDRVGVVAEKAFRRALFVTSPYAYPAKGTEESLGRIERATLIEFCRTYYRPNNAILAIVGDITREEVQSRLLPHLATWEEGKIPELPFPETFARETRVLKIDRPITQANIILGHAGVRRANEDFYALSVMNYVLGGGGLASRLAREIRVKRGLAYSVQSTFIARRHPGSFQIILQTKNASTSQAITLALEQMERMQREPISQIELETAKRYLIGSFPLRFTTQGGLADFFTLVEYYGLGLDYPERYPSLINSVTREDVLRVARAYLHPDRYILIVVADLKEAGLD